MATRALTRLLSTSDTHSVSHWTAWLATVACSIHRTRPEHLLVTARCYASVVLIAMALCPSVRPSVTSRCSTKTAKRRITRTTPHDSPGTLVFWCQRSQRPISKTVQDRRMVSIKVKQEVVCALSNCGIAHDLECLIPIPNHPNFCILYRRS